MKGGNKGFTLIELLVVIAIIGILAAFGLVAINDAKESARDARRLSDLSQVRLALALYFDDYVAYPIPITASGNGPDTSDNILNGSIFSEVNNPLVPNYISEILIDPVNNGDYYYFYDTNQNQGHRDFIICFEKESVNYTVRYFLASGQFGEGLTCWTLP